MTKEGLLHNMWINLQKQRNYGRLYKPEMVNLSTFNPAISLEVACDPASFTIKGNLIIDLDTNTYVDVMSNGSVSHINLNFPPFPPKAKGMLVGGYFVENPIGLNTYHFVNLVDTQVGISTRPLPAGGVIKGILFGDVYPLTDRKVVLFMDGQNPDLALYNLNILIVVLGMIYDELKLP